MTTAMLSQAHQELHRAEGALHAAHQTHNDKWITAASDHLHRAIVALEQCTAAMSGKEV
jgi:hypothetical protein